jgi:hypothetical protein
MRYPQRNILFILLTPIFFILAEWISVFPHEFAHSTVAWFFGFKESPFAIYYGHFNWQNIFFVTGIEENVNYTQIKAAGRFDVVGWIGFAGPIITLLFYVVTLLLLQWKKIKSYPYFYYFLFWMNILNLSELFSYIILRSFSSYGDMANIEMGWHVSPGYIIIIGGALVIFALNYLFVRTLPALYLILNLTISLRITILTLTTFFIFGHAGIRMLLYSYGTLATILGSACLISMPVMIMLFFPTRARTKYKTKLLKAKL